MSNQSDIDREAFQREHTKLFPFHTVYTRRDNGQYCDTHCELAWKLWCAARADRSILVEGYAIVPFEPTVEMVAAAFKSIRMWNKGTKDCVKIWASRAGKPHPHEPGIVTEIRAAIAAGAIGK